MILMKKIYYISMCFMLCLCSFVGVFARTSSSVQADGNVHTVTFNFNSSSIESYLPLTTDVIDSLKTYSISVENGGHAVESRKPQAIVLEYYNYNWTLNGAIVNLNNLVVTKDIALVAEWTPKEYCVYFQFESPLVRSEVTNLQEYQRFNVESGRIELYKPSRPHYYFKGWYVLGNPIEYLYIPARSIGDKYYTARFSPINYYINYNTSASNNNPTSYNVETSNITLVDPYAEGHIFQGWYSDNSFTNQVTTIDTAQGGNINLYPLWELEKYTVTYILPNGTSSRVEVEYGKKASLPKLEKSIFTIATTNVSRDNITKDTTIEIKYVNIWYVYVIALAVVAGIIVVVVMTIKSRRNTHSTLREFYQSNSGRRSGR